MRRLSDSSVLSLARRVKTLNLGRSAGSGGVGVAVPQPTVQNQMIIANATPAWTLLAAPAAEGQVPITGVDPYTPVWGTTFPAVIQFDVGLTFGGVSGANVITVPDNVAQAMHIVDAGATEYLRIVSTDAAEVVALYTTLEVWANTIKLTGDDNVELQIVSVGSNDADVELYCARGTIGSETAVVDADPIGSINANAYNGTVYKRIADITMTVDGTFSDDIPGRMDFQVWDADGTRNYAMTLKSTGFLGVGIITPAAHADVYDATVDVTATYRGIRSYHIKTAGASGEEDDFYGLYSHAEMNDGDSTIGHVIGVHGIAVLTSGTIGDGAEDLRGGNFEAHVVGGTVAGDVIGWQARANLDGGTISGDVYGARVELDIESAMTSISGNIYGANIYVIADKDPGGIVNILRLAGSTNVDHALYSSSSAPSYFAGEVTILENSATVRLTGTKQFVWSIPNPSVGTYGQVRIPWACTVRRVDGNIDGGGTSCAVNIEERATPGSAGTDILSSDMVADANTESVTSSFNDSALAEGNHLTIDISAVSGAVGEVTIGLTVTPT